MKQARVISSPNTFLVEEYSPGFTIDFRQPAATTDLEELKRSFDTGQFDIDVPEPELSLQVGRVLVSLGLTEDENDFSESLFAYTGERRLRCQLTKCFQDLGVHDAPEDLGQSITLLLKKTNCLNKSSHHALRLYCHAGGVTDLEKGSTHYGYLLDGECSVNEGDRIVPLRPNTFFCIAGAATIEGPGRCVLITKFNHTGITLYGGEVENWGRLNYLDGCTDTLLVSPLKKGDPCLNALYFPAGTEQTRHTHPSVRCGVIIDGEGVCKTKFRDYPLTRGKIFFLPPETYHSFHTHAADVGHRAALTVLAFHPDSDFGPTDADHPMINRTYFKFLHRLRSSHANAKAADI